MIRMRARTVLACLAVVGATTAIAIAPLQGEMVAAPKPKVALKMPATVKSGQTVKGTLTVTIPAGYHAYQNPPAKSYQIPLKVVAADKYTKVTKVTYPKGKTATAGGESAKVYNGKITIPVYFKAGASKNYKVKVSYQLCSASSCYPPSSLVARATVK